MTTNNSINTESLDNVLTFTANALSTGILEGGQLSINADPSLFDLTAGSGYIIDNHTDPGNPVQTLVSWGNFVGVAVIDIATQDFTNILMDTNGDIVQQLNDATPEEKRDFITIGQLAHLSRSFIELFFDRFIFVPDVGLQLTDLSSSIGIINRSGNVYSANGVNLNLDKSAGETYSVGSNLKVTAANPNITTDAGQVALLFIRTYRDGAGGETAEFGEVDINPDMWDDGSGTLATVPNNQFTNQHINYFADSTDTVVQFGQNLYSTQSDAAANATTESHEQSSSFDDGVIRSFLTVKKATTDLTDTGDALFQTAGKFGGATAGSGSSTVTLQTAYDNSVSPHIEVSAVGGALAIVDNSTPIAAPLFEVENNAQTTSFLSVDTSGAQIDGALTITNPLAVSSGGIGVATISGIMQGNGTGAVTSTADVAQSVLVSNTGGSLLWRPLTDGELAIGHSSAAPQAATLTPGTGVTIDNAPGSITINSTVGDVVGPASSTDSVIARYEGVSGKLLEDSTVVLGDSGALVGLLSVDPGNMLLAANTISSTTGDINIDPDGASNVNITGSLTITNPLAVSEGGTGATTIDGILQGNGTGAVTAITDVAQSVFTTSVSGVPNWTDLSGNGLLIIGNGGGSPTPANLTPGTGIDIVNSTGAITINSTGGGVTWTVVTGTSQLLTVNNGFIGNNAGTITYTLEQGIVGSVVEITNFGVGLPVIAQLSGDTIHFGSVSTTVGVSGSLTAVDQFASLKMVCCVASNEWIVISSTGNWVVI